MAEKKERFDTKTKFLVSTAEDFAFAYKDAILDAYLKIYTSDVNHVESYRDKMSAAELIDDLACIMYEVYVDDNVD